MKNKYMEIDFEIIAKALTKLHFVIIGAVVFGLVGLLAGYGYINFLQKPAKSEAEEFIMFDIEDIEDDMSYYYSVEREFELLSSNITNLIQIIVDNKDYENLEQLREFEEKFNDYLEKNLKQYSDFIDSNYIVPPNMAEEAIDYYENKIKEVEIAIISSQTSIDFLNSINSPIPAVFPPANDSDVLSVINTYRVELNNAALISMHTSNMAEYINKVNRLNDTQLITDDFNHAEMLVEELSAETMLLISELNQIMQDIAKNNNLIISLYEDSTNDIAATPHEFSIEIIHTYREIDRTESLLAFTVFFALVGTALGFLYALTKVAKIEDIVAEKKDD